MKIKLNFKMFPNIILCEETRVLSVFHMNFVFFYFPNACYARKYCNNEKIRLWHLNILMRSEISWIHLCHFYGDVCIYVCRRVCVYDAFKCMWVNMIASKRCTRLSSNLVCILQVTVGRTLLILVNIGRIVFLQEYKEEFLYITA